MGPWPLATHIHWRTRPKERSWSDLGSKPTSPAPSLLSRPKRGCVDSGSQATGVLGWFSPLARSGREQGSSSTRPLMRSRARSAFGGTLGSCSIKWLKLN